MREPTTTAGRVLIEQLYNYGDTWDPADITAIEEEARAAALADLAAKVARLEPHGPPLQDADWGWRDCRNAVLALIAEPGGGW